MKPSKAILGTVLALVILSVPVIAQDSVDKVILATNVNYPDAAVSSAVSQKLGVPILLTAKDHLSGEASSALEDLNPQEVIVVGGPAVIFDQVIQDLKGEGYELTRLWGWSRYGTAREVAGELLAGRGLFPVRQRVGSPPRSAQPPRGENQ